MIGEAKCPSDAILVLRFRNVCKGGQRDVHVVNRAHHPVRFEKTLQPSGDLLEIG